MSTDLEFRSAYRGQIQIVLLDGKRVGELNYWKHSRPACWRFINNSRAHFNAGSTLDAAKTWVAKYLNVKP